MPALTTLSVTQMKAPSTQLQNFLLDGVIFANNKSYEAIPMLYTPLGSASGPLVEIDHYGCNSSDFPSVFESSNTSSMVALISRGGGCTFAQKSALALTAGASAAVIYNDIPSYRLNGTLAVTGEYVPTLGITRAVGEGFLSLLRAGQTVEVSISVTERPPPPPPPPPTCADLSDRGRVFSTLLTVFVGSLISGLAAGFYAPAFGMFAVWLGPLRVVLAGIYMVASACLAIRHEQLIGTRTIGKELFRHSYLHRPNDPPAYPTFWGWLGWVYLACYSPVIQLLWLAENMDDGRRGIVGARAMGVLLLAVPLTMESRAAYAFWLKKWVGHGTGIMFYFTTALAAILLGIVAAVELGKSLDRVVLILGAIYGTMLTFISFMFASPDDEGEPQTHWRQLLGGIAMSVICGFLVGAPALAIYVDADPSGVGLSEYLNCEEVAWWRKITAVLP